MYTQLKNRKLWYDGDSSYNEEDIHRLLSQRKVKWVDKITPEIKEYNALANKQDQIQVKTNLNDITPVWSEEVSSISMDDILDYISYKHAIITKNLDDNEIDMRDIRLASELLLFTKTPSMIDMVKSIIYVINTLSSKKQVWGVGRGSSVSSYLLYVIGAHDVDSFAYDLNISDFIAPSE